MSSKYEDLKTLRIIQDVRAAQTIVAQLAVVKAQAEVGRLEAAHAQLEQKMQTDAVAWAQAMAIRPLPVELAQSWSVALKHSRRAFESGEVVRDQARQEAVIAIDHWNMAQGRETSLRSLTRRTDQALKKEYARTQVAEAADRFLQRRGSYAD